MAGVVERMLYVHPYYNLNHKYHAFFVWKLTIVASITIISLHMIVNFRRTHIAHYCMNQELMTRIAIGFYFTIIDS